MKTDITLNLISDGLEISIKQDDKEVLVDYIKDLPALVAFAHDILTQFEGGKKDAETPILEQAEQEGAAAEAGASSGV